MSPQRAASVIEPSSDGWVSRHHSDGESMLPLIWTRAVTVFGPAVQVTLPTTEPFR